MRATSRSRRPSAPSPTAATLLVTPSFWGHVGATALAFVYSLVISAVLGVLLGLVLGMRRFAGDVMEPLIAALYTTLR